MMNLPYKKTRNKQSRVLVLTGYGLSLKVQRGQLIITDGFANEGKRKTTILSRGTININRIIILGHSGNISLDALRWLEDFGIVTAIIGPDGELISSILNNEAEVSLKRKQALAVTNGLDLVLTQWLLERKISEQSKVLSCFYGTEREQDARNAQTFAENALQRLRDCLCVDDARLVEAQVAGSYWRTWEGLFVPWVNWTKEKVPEQWLRVGTRSSPKTGTPRKAIDPTNALLNFTYSLLEVEIRLACRKEGLDPDLGVLHTDKANRSSFVYDLMEPVRPKIDAFILKLIREGNFHIGDFHETREGICRIDSDLAINIAEKINFTSFVEEVVSEIKRLIEAWDGICRINNTIEPQTLSLLKDLDSNITSVLNQFTVANKNETVVKKTRKKTTEINKQLAERLKKLTTKSIAESLKKEQQIKVKEEKIVEPKECLECGETFVPTANGQRFCCKAHSNRFRQKKIRERRIAGGLCPMCGSDMPKAQPWGKRESLYCEKCTEVRRESKRKSRNKTEK